MMRQKRIYSLVSLFMVFMLSVSFVADFSVLLSQPSQEAVSEEQDDEKSWPEGDVVIKNQVEATIQILSFSLDRLWLFSFEISKIKAFLIQPKLRSKVFILSNYELNLLQSLIKTNAP